MFDQPLWYWGLFVVAALLVAAVPVVVWWEDRQDARDQDAWNRVHRPELRERAR